MNDMTKEEKMAAVERLRQEKKLNIPEACKEVGWNASGYYDAKKKMGSKALTVPRRAAPKRQPEVIHVMDHEEDDDDNVTVIVMKGKGATIEKISAALGGVL